MRTFRPIVLAAAVAGLLAGLTVTAAQQFGTVPLILQAEVYERAADATGEATAPAAGEPALHEHEAAVPHVHEATAGGHDHGEAWEPQDGLERTVFTAAFDVVTQIGFGLILLAAMVVARAEIDWRSGFAWGLAGFLAVSVAPSFGLPPELPGIPAAELEPRQVWWIATVVATAAGLRLIASHRNAAAAVAAVVLIAAPHLVGAPQLDEVVTNVPEALAHRFIVAVMLTTLLSWSLLGALAGEFYRRFAAAEAVPRLATA